MGNWPWPYRCSSWWHHPSTSPSYRHAQPTSHHHRNQGCCLFCFHAPSFLLLASSRCSSCHGILNCLKLSSKTGLFAKDNVFLLSLLGVFVYLSKELNLLLGIRYR